MHNFNDDALNLLFRDARSYSAWLNRPVEDDTLRQLYDLAKWGPTSANAGPARFIFVRSQKAKERLRPALSPGNIEKTMTAPVTVIVAYDLKFYDKLPKLFPIILACVMCSQTIRNWLRLPPNVTPPFRART